MHTQVKDASLAFIEQSLIRPLIISSGPITEVTEARVEVWVQVEGREAVGKGSIYLSDLWAWPDPAFSHAERDAVLRRLCEQIAADLGSLCGGQPAHPLELGLQLHHQVCEGGKALLPDTDPDPPVLAKSMCLSPFDAAIHDAVGQALEMSAFRFYVADTPIPSADPLLGGSACGAIRALLRPHPVTRLPAWWVVGKNDDLERDLRPYVQQRGYRCFKLKIMGRDNAADVARTVEVFQTARQWGVNDIQLTVDTNEANPDAASVLDYLQRLRTEDEGAFQALQYLEQPTGRDIRAHRYDWREVGRLKPVMLDEGLTSLELLEEARAQAWSGLALKTCKGHSFALVAAAWAHQQGMLLSLQDLTNPGYSGVHAALFAAHVPTLNGVELNSPQFTPAANQEWLPRWSGLFEPKGGYHYLPEQMPPGLGGSQK